MTGDTNEAFFAHQSNELRKRYHRAQEGSCKLHSMIAAADSNPNQKKAQTILCLILILYSAILITFVILLYQVSEFRYFCYEMLEHINEKGPWLGAILIGLIGYWFVLTGFNVVLYDIISGFLIHPFWFALTIVSLAKFFAKCTGFLCGRYLIRDFIYTAMNDNQYFIVCYLATERKPIKVMLLLQFLAVPTIFKTYACGLFRITHFEYLGPTLFGTVVWCAFWVYLGSKLDTITDALTTGDTSHFLPLWFKIAMGVVVGLIIFYLFRLTNQIYKEIQSDASLADLSHILEKEDEQEKMLPAEQSEL